MHKTSESIFTKESSDQLQKLVNENYQGGQIKSFFINNIIPTSVGAILSGVTTWLDKTQALHWVVYLLACVVVILIWFQWFSSFTRKNKIRAEQTIISFFELEGKKAFDAFKSSEIKHEEELEKLEDVSRKFENDWVIEKTRSAYLAKISNERIRDLKSFCEGGRFCHKYFVEDFLCGGRNKPIGSLLEGLVFYLKEVCTLKRSGDSLGEASFRVALWVPGDGNELPSSLKISLTRSSGKFPPTELGCTRNFSEHTDDLLVQAWKSKIPQAIEDCHETAKKGAVGSESPMKFAGAGWAYRISSVCAIPIPCPISSKNLGVIWLDTDLKGYFKQDHSAVGAFQMDPIFWKEILSTSLSDFVNRISFYLWLQKCTDLLSEDDLH